MFAKYYYHRLSCLSGIQFPPLIYNQATNSWIGPMTAMLYWCYEDEKESCEDVSLLVSQISGTTELNGIDVVEIVQPIVIRIMRPPWLKEWSSITSANSSGEEGIATAGGLGLSWLEIYLLHDQTCQMVRHPNVKSSQPHLYLECHLLPECFRWHLWVKAECPFELLLVCVSVLSDAYHILLLEQPLG